MTRLAMVTSGRDLNQVDESARHKDANNRDLWRDWV